MFLLSLVLFLFCLAACRAQCGGWDWKYDNQTNFCYTDLTTPTPLTWHQAKKLCEELDPTSRLTSIHSDHEHDLIYELLNVGPEKAWIGFKMDDDGKFKWDDGTPVDYLKRHMDPRGPYRKDFACAIIEKEKIIQKQYVSSNMWGNRRCDFDEMRKAICKKPAETKSIKSVRLPSGVCYEDSWSRVLDVHLSFQYDNSPALCAEACRQKGYKYAGVEYETHCFCGRGINNANGKKLPDGKICDVYDCPVDKNYKCGGSMLITIYETRKMPKLPTLRLDGCYQDHGYTLLPYNNKGWWAKFDIDNSPPLCTEACRQRGYKYAGVIDGIYCYCGNELNLQNNNKKIGINDCNIKPCPGNNQTFCGGPERNLVYRTGN